jgi:hypothetical protein
LVVAGLSDVAVFAVADAGIAVGDPIEVSDADGGGFHATVATRLPA